MARLRSPRLLQCRCVDHHETPPLLRKDSLWQIGRPKTSWSLLRNFSNVASGSYALILRKMPQFSSQQKELKKNALLSSLTASNQKPPDFHKPMKDITTMSRMSWLSQSKDIQWERMVRQTGAQWLHFGHLLLEFAGQKRKWVVCDMG